MLRPFYRPRGASIVSRRRPESDSLGFVADQRADWVAVTHAPNIPGHHLENTDRQAIFPTQSYGRRIHDPQMVVQETVVADAGEKLGIRETSWIAVVRAIDFGGF